jgi:molybdopterin converting factor small subunit
MGHRIIISPVLQEQGNLPETLEVDGHTVGECLDDLIRQYPRIRDYLYDRNGLLRALFTVNNVDIVTPGLQDRKRVLHDNDELQLLVIFAGG